jgi:hypothetical protein
MPMTNAGMSAAIQAQLTSIGWSWAGNAAYQAQVQEFCDALAEAIVGYIQANATVVPTALVAPSGGGPVTGVGTVT